MASTSTGKHSRRQVGKQAVTPPRIPRPTAAPKPAGAPLQTPAPTSLTLTEQKLDFTAEGSPPPGKVATEVPLTDHDHTLVTPAAPAPAGKRAV